MKILHIGLCVNPNGYSSFPQAFKDVLGEENYRELPTNEVDLNAKALIIAAEFKPDIVFMQIQAENIIFKSTCEAFKQLDCYVINWTGDKRHTVPQWMIDLAPYVNCTSFSNMDDVNTMRSLGYHSEYLEIGYDESIYTPIGEKLDMPDIVFMGNNYGHGYFPMSTFRIEMVEFLQRNYGNRFGVYGNGWQNGNGNFNHSQHEEAKAYRGAKLAINCSHFDSLNYNSDRLLRILGSGVTCISYAHKGMLDTYKDNVGYFIDLNNLKETIDYVLNNYDKKSLSGNEFVLNTFTFKHQVENIIKLKV